MRYISVNLLLLLLLLLLSTVEEEGINAGLLEIKSNAKWFSTKRSHNTHISEISIHLTRKDESYGGGM